MANTLAEDIRKEALINGCANAFFNGLIAWWLLQDSEPLGLLGSGGMLVDLAATGFILVFIVTLIVVAINRRKVASGEVAFCGLEQGNALHGLLARLPAKSWLTGLLFGSFALLVVAPATGLLLWLFGVHSLPGSQYAIFKGVWAGLLAALMVGPMITYARATASRPGVSTA